MHEYVHIPLSSSISINSLISAYHRELKQHFDDGEKLTFTELFYVESGSYSLYIDNKEFTVNAGQLLLFSPGAFYCSAKRNDATVSIISFSSDSPALKTLYNRLITLSTRQYEMLRNTVNLCLDVMVWSRIFDNYGFSIKEGTDDLTLQEIKNSLELLLINLCKTVDRPESYDEKLFSAITTFLKGHICEKLTLSDIADNFSMSISKLKRICASHCNTSPIDYFISLKLIEAKRLIEETDLNISQISDRLGFSSIHYFSKLFKSKNGVSPSHYARMLKTPSTDSDAR